MYPERLTNNIVAHRYIRNYKIVRSEFRFSTGTEGHFRLTGPVLRRFSIVHFGEDFFQALR